MCKVEDKLEEMKKILRNEKKPPIFFVGSGLSRRYLESPNWEELLRKIAQFVKCDYEEIAKLCNGEYEEIAQELEYYCFKYAEIESFEKKGHRQIIRAIIAKILNEKKEEYLKESTQQKNEEFNKKIEERLDNIEELGGENIVTRKVQECANQYDDITKEIKKYSYNLKKAIEINELQQINPKALITTNYDTLLEEIIFTNRCNVQIGQNNFSSVLDENKINLYKIHGCITKPESIIITKEDYDNFFQKSKYVYSKIFTLLWEYPVIFIGYSISDRNIKDILTVMIDIMTEEDKKRFLKRIWIVDYVRHEEDECVKDKDIELLNGKIIKVTCFYLKYYDKFFKAINGIGFYQQFGELRFTTSKNVIELLIEPLYQQQEKLKVVTRELLQNALDACKIIDVSAKIKIRVTKHKDNYFLEIEDNGIGMNSQEIKENFLTVGKSSKNNCCKGLVGKYGVGILSIFLIGNYAEVYTKKSKSVLLPLKIYIDKNEKSVEWLDLDDLTIDDNDKESFTIVRIRLNNELNIENIGGVMEALGLRTYITRPENTIEVEFMNEKEEVPKVDKTEWFLDLPENVKIYKKSWLNIDESDLNEKDKHLKKLLDRNNVIFYNDMISPAVFDVSKYKQLKGIDIPFVMLDVKDANIVKEDIKTDLSRSNIQVSGKIMRSIARGIYKLEIEKIVELLSDNDWMQELDVTDYCEILKKIRNSSTIVGHNVDILFYKNKIIFSKVNSCEHINIWGNERFLSQMNDNLNVPILYYNFIMDRSSISDIIKYDNLICISTKYLEKYIYDATNPQNGLRKESLIKILHYLGFKDIQENCLSTYIWQYIKDKKQDIKKAYNEKAFKGVLWLKDTYDIKNIDANNDYFIIFESSFINKCIDDDFYEILECIANQKSLKNIVDIYKDDGGVKR